MPSLALDLDLDLDHLRKIFLVFFLNYKRQTKRIISRSTYQWRLMMNIKSEETVAFSATRHWIHQIGQRVKARTSGTSAVDASWDSVECT